MTLEGQTVVVGQKVREAGRIRNAVAEGRIGTVATVYPPGGYWGVLVDWSPRRRGFGYQLRELECAEGV